MKTPLIYGAGITIANAIVTLAMHIFGLSTEPQKMFAAMVIGFPSVIAILLTGIILGTKKARAEQGASGFSYGQAFKTGFLIVFFAGLTGAFFHFIYYTFLFPNFAEVAIEWTRSFMEKMGLPPSKIDQELEEMRTKMTVIRQTAQSCIGMIGMGTIAALITAAIMKRPPPDSVPDQPPSLS